MISPSKNLPWEEMLQCSLIIPVALIFVGVLTGCSESGAENEAVCGDNVRDGTELCDGIDLDGLDCETLGFVGGTLTCNASCLGYDPSGCLDDLCGDGAVGTDEECDGVALNGQTCEQLGYSGGTLDCSTDCALDTSGCEPPLTCGDGAVQSPEDCDGDDLNGQTCAGLGHVGGTLLCTDDCTFDDSGCTLQPTCGDGTANGSEECDDADLRSDTCEGLGYASGMLDCTASCLFDTSNCVPLPDCGNGVIDSDEQCDDVELGGATCETLGFDGGTLGCTGSCVYDQSGCHACGNATIEGPEVCDGADVGGETCQSQAGASDGTLLCGVGCATFDTSPCHTVGNGIIEGPEMCDGTNLGGETCLGHTGMPNGVLTCSADGLSFDTSTCHMCGNGVREATEECDAADVGSASCQTLGYDGGPIACASDCTLDTSLCADVPSCVRFVDIDSTTPAPDGLAWQSAFTDVQDAVDSAYLAVVGGEPLCDVWVASGTYYLYDGSTSDKVLVFDNVHLFGGFAGVEIVRTERDWDLNPTVIHGAEGPAELFRVSSAVLIDGTGTLDGFTVTGSNGGLGVSGTGVADVAHCTFTDMLLGVGLADGATAVVEDCAFLNNDAGGLNAGANDFTCSLTVINSDFFDNVSSSYGGAIDSQCQNTIITGCRFHRNEASNSYGAIRLSAQALVTHCEFVENYAPNCGAMTGTFGQTISNNVFLNNRALRGGALCLAAYDNAEITDSTFIGNQAVEQGGAIWVRGMQDYTTSWIRRCRFVGNQAANGGVVSADRDLSGALAYPHFENCLFEGNKAEFGSVAYSTGQWARVIIQNSLLIGNLSPNSLIQTVNQGEVLIDNSIIRQNFTHVMEDHWYIDISSSNFECPWPSCNMGSYSCSVNCIDVDPYFENAPVQWAKTSNPGTQSTFLVSGASTLFMSGQVVEIGGDGVARAVTSVAGDIVSFTPSDATLVDENVQIRNWGFGATDLDLDFHLELVSPCIDVANDFKGPPLDLEGNPRVDVPGIGNVGVSKDMGLYEYQL